MTDRPFSQWLGSDVHDRGCEATFAVLDRYVEAVARGDDVATRYAHVITHLRNCTACREDAEGLLATIEDIDPPPPAR